MAVAEWKRRGEDIAMHCMKMSEMRSAWGMVVKWNEKWLSLLKRCQAYWAIIAVASCFSSIPWLCLMHAPNAWCHILSLYWDSSVDPTQTCTYSSSSIKGCKCQPENSSLVLLVFSPQQPGGSSSFDSLESQLMLLTFGLFQCLCYHLALIHRCIALCLPFVHHGVWWILLGSGLLGWSMGCICLGSARQGGWFRWVEGWWRMHAWGDIGMSSVIGWISWRLSGRGSRWGVMVGLRLV